MSRKLYLTFIPLLLSLTGIAQVVSSGKEFYFSTWDNGFPGHTFHLVSKEKANVNFHFFANPALDFSVTVHPDTLFDYYCTPINTTAIGGGRLNQTTGGVIENKSLRICSDKNISVVAYIASGRADDATLLYPVQQPAIDSTPVFLVVNQEGSFANAIGTRPTIIVSHFDNVTLELTLKHNLGIHPAGIPFQITLNEGETFTIARTIQAVLNIDTIDFSGSVIKVLSGPARNPVSVITYATSGYILYPGIPPNWSGSSYCCQDRLFDQNLPVSTWDTIYHFVPPLFDSIPGKFMPCMNRIISASANNNIYINGGLVANLNYGEIFDTLLPAPSIIRSDYPVSASFFTLSWGVMKFILALGSNVGDPDQQWLSPLRNGINEAIFQRFQFGVGFDTTSRTALTLITDSSAFNITLDGVDITGNFVPFPSDPRYIYAQIFTNTLDTFRLVSDKKVVAYLSGFIEQGGYTTALGGLIVDNDSLFKGRSSSAHFCDSISLHGREGAKNYLWNTGAASYSIIANSPGTYLVTSLYCAYSITDTFHLSTASNVPPLDLDTILCQGDTLNLDAYHPLVGHYQWSTGDTTASTQVTGPGTYYVTRIPDGFNCQPFDDTIHIASFELPELTLPDDATLCNGTVMHLGSRLPGMSYLWNTGDTACCIEANRTGHYEVRVTNICGDSILRDINLEYHGCDNCLLVPNAFSPNGDGLNDVFRVVQHCKFSSFHLDIYNRFGEKVFTTYKPEQGWDGTYKGQPADLGVYFYQLSATPLPGEQEQVFLKGDVTLIR